MSDDFAESLNRASLAIASHMAAATEDQLCAAVLDGFIGRLWCRVTDDITAAVPTTGLEFLRLPADAPSPWPGTACVFYELDAAAYERIAAYVQGRTDVLPPAFKMEVT